MKYLLSLLLLSPFTLGEEAPTLPAFPSFQGFQGVVNTPNAEVLNEGEVQILYTNQVDALENTNPDFRNDKEQRSYFLNIGGLPNMEMSLRYTYANNLLNDSQYMSDRIFNFKYQLPLIPKDFATFAVGMQDISGGARKLGSTYGVASKVWRDTRMSLGYAQKREENSYSYGALDGVFGSVEYTPFNWLNVAGEYDTKDWNVVAKSQYNTKIVGQKLNVGLMGKSSFTYNKLSLGLYASMPFKDDFLPYTQKKQPLLSHSMSALKTSMGLNNISSHIEDETLHFSYENTLYSWNDMDALGMVLGILATHTQAKTIVVTVKKSNIPQYQVEVDSEDYRLFLEEKYYKPNLLKFKDVSRYSEGTVEKSDKFRPLLRFKPSFILVDGSEYGDMDYTFSVQAGLSMRVADGLILSGQYNVPLGITDNFDEGGIFDYRNRNKTSAMVDQLLLSKYFQTNLPNPWINLLQVGLFDNELSGVSWESALKDESGKHLFMLKLSYLKDGIYQQMDRYSDSEYREAKLLSYQYYIEPLNSNIKVTAGEWLYGDRGASVSLKRYFGDMFMQFDLSKTEHQLRGSNNVARVTLSIPFGPKKRIKTEYIDIDGGDLVYNRRKTLVSQGELSYAQPLHLSEVDNDFTLERYYLDEGRLHRGYIENNRNRLLKVVGEE